MSLRFPDELVIGGSGEWDYKPFRFSVRKINIGKSEPSWIDVLLSGVSPLVLTNAIEDGLNYLKLFGGTEQRNLPVGYTQVEYLQSSGTQWIDTQTEIIPKNYDTIIDLTIGKCTNLVNSENGIFGVCRKSGGGVWSNVGGTRWKTVSTLRGAWGTNYGDNTVTQQDINYLHIEKNNVTFNNNTLNNFTFNTTVSDPYTILLFATRPQTDKTGAISIYYCKISNTNGEILRELIPARRNSDNVLGMYDTVTGNFLTNQGTGTFTAGADAVPTPDTPMNIVSNNGVVKLTPNLLDRSKETQGKYINNNTGSIDSTSSPWAVSDYIPVVAGSKITISGITFSSTAAGYNYYNSQKALVSTISYETGTHTYTVPDNASYIMICYRYNPDDKVRINVGDSANSIYADGTVETVQVTGKNLFDGQWQQGIYNTSSGAYTPTTNRICNINMIQVESSTNYTVSCPTYALENGMRWVFYDANKNFVSAITNGATTITTPSNAKYINFYIANNPTVDTAPDLQLEQSSTATTYEAYFNGGSATAEMLLKVGAYKDEQSVIDGNVTRRLGVKVFDGTENWSTGSATNPNRYTLAAAFNDLADLTDNNIGYSNCYTVISRSTSIQSSLQNNECGWNKTKVFCVRDDRIATLTDWKQFLATQYEAGTPVIVIYPLATSTTESVTAQPLTVQTGTNIVTITQASIDNLSLEVSYKAAAQVTITEVQNSQLSNNVEVTIND